MAKEYVVLEGKKYVGKHRIYTEGKTVPESEIMSKDDKNLLVNGSKAVIKDRKNGAGGTEKVTVKKAFEPKLKIKTKAATKKAAE